MNNSYILYIHDHKFLCLNEKYYSEGKFTTEVFSRYDAFNADITVISRVIENNQGSNLNKISNENISFKPVRGVGFSSVFTKYFFTNTRLIVREIKKADALIIRLPSFLGIFILILNIFFKKKYFIELVGDPQEALITSKKKVGFLFKCFIYIFSAFNKFFVKKADGVIYVTKYDLQQRYPTKKIQACASNVEVNIKPLDLDLNEYTLKDEKNIKIGLIGSFNNEYKGIDNALKAIHLLKEQDCMVQLHILGSGKLKDHYLEMANELEIAGQIYFDGSLSGGEAVLNWLKGLDLYIQPSRTEGLPRALIEAMSTGLPCIATNVGGIPELLHEDDLVDKDSPVTLAKRISEAVKSQELRYQMGQRNYSRSLDYDAKQLNKIRSEFWEKAAETINESD
ncbi:glycosyltransferase family 4 protein [Acinetobacter indicus]|uniref:glycosyltransferase family 4 protein n=1 Tax=Acinetobacter TaxID=469 RepID=UPI0015D3126A|nr:MULTISPECIES: glycosyltransferase family 4 protein [Acinetobacter]MCP0915030.1 glycosyltransferase family 4 protein [Acinetobacter indicus]MCP0918155.1 glycosyltransferase family 4 protein [Acinetobacter indicus]MCP0920821.1 glycosyltransferase family 4 protein [Acinetobacter indicus]